MLNFRGGHQTKSKIVFGCITVLGATAGAGIANVEINSNEVTKLLSTVGNWFKGESSTSSRPDDQYIFNPIESVASAGAWINENVFAKISEFAQKGYEWSKEQDNKETITSFLKNFWNFEFLKQAVFHFPWTVLAWVKILVDKEMILKFPSALKRALTLSGMFISKKIEQITVEMVNWLVARLLINPRKTLNILTRPLDKGLKQLICNNGSGGPRGPQGGKAQWLGTCFFENGGQKPKQQLKLKAQIKDFLMTGENLKDKSRKKTK